MTDEQDEVRRPPYIDEADQDEDGNPVYGVRIRDGYVAATVVGKDIMSIRTEVLSGVKEEDEGVGVVRLVQERFKADMAKGVFKDKALRESQRETRYYRNHGRLVPGTLEGNGKRKEEAWQRKLQRRAERRAAKRA